MDISSQPASRFDDATESLGLVLFLEETDWLRETTFGNLPSALIEAIAPCLHKIPFAVNRRLVLLEPLLPEVLPKKKRT
jgi:hypothetical protein